MKEIAPTNSSSTIKVDDEDYPLLARFNWHVSDNGYAMTQIRGVKHVKMHHLVWGAIMPTGRVLDHINRDKLDNRKCNLRCVTQKENLHNTERYENYKGYYFDNHKQRWTIDSKRFGIKSLYMESEESCKKYLEDLSSGRKPVREFARRTPKGKLGDKIGYIFAEKEKGRSDAAIAKDLGASYSAVHRVVRGISYGSGRIRRKR